MQRILTLGMLAALGGISWLFLQGGGLDQIAVGRADRAPSPTVFGQGAGSRNAVPSRQQSPARSPHSDVTPLTDAQTVRIASFNIQVFGKTKASKPYVMNSLADIVRQFDLLTLCVPAENRDLCLEVRGLYIGDQTPFESRVQALLESWNLSGRAIC